MTGVACGQNTEETAHDTKYAVEMQFCLEHTETALVR